MPEKINFKTMAQSIIEPHCFEKTPFGQMKIDMLIPDFSKMFGNQEHLHVIFHALLEYYAKFKELPKVNDKEDGYRLFELTKEVIKRNKTITSDIKIEIE